MPSEAPGVDLWSKLTEPTTLQREFWVAEGEGFRRRTYGEVIQDARRVAAGLRKRGVRPGSTVAAVITNAPSAMAGALGIGSAGATVASLPIIARGMSIPRYLAQLARICRLLGTDLLLAEDRFVAMMPAGADLGVDLVGYGSLVDSSEMADIDPVPLDDTAFIQFSSGTTGEPRGIALTGRAVLAQLAALDARLKIDPERDTGYTWLPLSHDMGFFGCLLLTWYTGIRGVLSTPERFLRSPRTWFEDCARFGATFTAGPPAALDVATRAERLSRGGAPLSLRRCLVGAEQIEWDVLVDAAETFASRGLTMRTFAPAYGMAEATLTVTLEDEDAWPSYLDIDGEALAQGVVREVSDRDDRETKRLVCVGTPLAGVGVRTDPDSGEILVRSPSLTSGYVNDARLTRERLRDGELHTGDIGLLREGKLYIAGRNDDLLILGGRNLFAHGLEEALGSSGALRSGCCAIVQTSGRTGARVALVAELASGAADAPGLTAQIAQTAMREAGLRIDDFVFLATGSFPKTPSGKIQRYRCRQLADQHANRGAAGR
jgi:fatty-acyl-CoA synthase